MKVSSNALALFLLTTHTSHAFVVHPPSIRPFRTSPLGYVQEEYGTGIGKDFLRKKKKKPQQSPPVVVEETEEIIDAVVIEEGYFVDDLDEKEEKVLQPHKDSQRTSTSNEPSIWDTHTAKTIQGGALRTYSMEVPEIDHTQVLLRSEMGHPLHAQIDVWDGPDQAPMKMAIYCAQTTSEQPFSCVIPTPGYNKQSIGIKNSGPLEFPIESVVIADVESVKEQQKRQSQQQQPARQPGYNDPSKSVFLNDGMFGHAGPNHTFEKPPKSTSGLGLFAEKLRSLGDLRKIEGTSPVGYAKQDQTTTNEEVFDFSRTVDSVQVLIETNGLSCQARIEITADGIDDIQQVVELSIQDGQSRPFFAVLDTSHFPRHATQVRVINLDPYSAFPITACVEPYTIRDDDDDGDDDGFTAQDKKGFDFIDATMVDDEQDQDDEPPSPQPEEDYPVYAAVPDITIPANLEDYDFDEEFFFAS